MLNSEDFGGASCGDGGDCGSLVRVGFGDVIGTLVTLTLLVRSAVVVIDKQWCYVVQ